MSASLPYAVSRKTGEIYSDEIGEYLSVADNHYSVPAQWAGQRRVSVHAYADHIRIVADKQVIAEHARVFGRERLILDPWHYLPVLERKPGALRTAPLPELGTARPDPER